jgi:nitroreductase
MAMEFRELVVKRQSIREYLETPVPEDKLNRILEAARLAPSGGNRQQWKFIVVRDSGLRAKLMEAANNQPMVGQAPVIIATVALDPVRLMLCDVPSYAVDLAIATEHMVLAAADEGLAACWIGAFHQDKAREVLGIPSRYKVVSLFPVGYANQTRPPSPRKSLAEIICYESFKE